MIASLVPALLALAGGENRLWFVDLELRGACAEVRLECGADGLTRFLGPFASGEDRRASVPVPVQSALGAEGLALVPLPEVRVLPAGSPASVRVLGWSAEQPAASLARRAGPMLARARPPVAGAAARAAWPELVLVLLAGGFLVRFRRQLAASLVLALAAGYAALELARSRALQAEPVRLLEWEAGGTLALSVRAAMDELVLSEDWLEVVPAGRALELVVTEPGGGKVLAPGACLVAVEGAAVPVLAAGENGAMALAAVWTRAPVGAWLARGPWPEGAPLGSAAPAGSSDPPGWLASALPPGRPVLLARTVEGEWLRCLGFEAEGGAGDQED